jgi:predicted DNA binding protein
MPLKSPAGGSQGATRFGPFQLLSSQPDRLAIMKLEIGNLSSLWYDGFSRRHPELVLEATSVTTLPGNDTLGEYEIYGPPEDWTNEISESPDVVEVERLGDSPEFGRYRIRYRRSPLIALATELEVLVRYPRTIRNGTLSCEVIARISQLRRAVDALSRAGSEPRLVSLRRDSLRSVRMTLTPTQRILLRQALALGYFEVPRQITLTRLAEKVSRSKSSVSTTLATLERKLAESAAAAGA